MQNQLQLTHGRIPIPGTSTTKLIVPVVLAGGQGTRLWPKVTMLAENQLIYLPPGCTHRLANPGNIQLELIEVQTGPYLGEDDIIRIEDEFGRA